jgi:folate-binding protein YgfZ
MASAYQAARQRAAWIDRSSRGRLVVSGKDRASYLQGLLTNDIVALTAGSGCYAAYLTPQGRMISDLWVYELGDVILLDLPSVETKNTVLEKLDQFIFSEDVQLGDVTEVFAQIAVIGPASSQVVGALLAESATGLAALTEHACLRGSIAGGSAIVTRITDTGEPGFDVYVEKARLMALTTGLAAAGLTEVDKDTADILRVEAGVPLFHRDMDEDTIPLEAGIEARAINMNKGCYVGQEVIVRVLHRGHGRVAKKLEGLTLEGDAVPSTGAAITNGDQEIGKITSAVRSPALDRPIALAYLHRDFLQAGTKVTVGTANAVVTALPFVTTDSSQPDRSR